MSNDDSTPGVASSDQQYARDNAILPKLHDVKSAVAQWASTSTDGGSVWHIAETVHKVFDNWGIARTLSPWAAPGPVIAELEYISLACPADRVGLAAVLAKDALNEYKE